MRLCLRIEFWELIFLLISFNQMEDELARRRQIILRTDWFQICFFPDDCVSQYPPLVLQSNSHSMGNILRIFAEESIPKMWNQIFNVIFGWLFISQYRYFIVIDPFFPVSVEMWKSFPQFGNQVDCRHLCLRSLSRGPSPRLPNRASCIWQKSASSRRSSAILRPVCWTPMIL